jgi:homoserine dehydrogenase
MASRTPLRVAVLGAGTVGGSVVRAFLEHPDRLAPFDGRQLLLAGVAEKDFARARALGVPDELLTDAPAHLVADPGIDAVVELMGGDEPAHTLAAAALSAGKAVVTANKHMVARRGPELEAIARRTGAPLRFEAAVGGGIPVLSPLAADLAANTVARVRGIVNGTTNFILTAMGEGGRSYDDVLAEAQARGYAEADPRGDVEGDDAVNKLVLLARLAFRTWLEPESIVRRPPTVRDHGRPGITGITSEEMAGAYFLGLDLKLLAAVEASGDGQLAAAVVPTAVPQASPLGGTDGVLNRIEIRAEPVGDVAFAGPGAGGDATSSAVLGDLVAIARGGGSTWAGLAPTAGSPVPADADAPFASSRAWFAFLPGVGPEAVRRDALGDGAAVEEVLGGTAVRTGSLALGDARAALVPSLPDGVDATLYPVTD